MTYTDDIEARVEEQRTTEATLEAAERLAQGVLDSQVLTPLHSAQAVQVLQLLAVLRGKQRARQIEVA